MVGLMRMGLLAGVLMVVVACGRGATAGAEGGPGMAATGAGVTTEAGTGRGEARGAVVVGLPTVGEFPMTVVASCMGYFVPGTSAWMLSVNSAGQGELVLIDGRGTRRRVEVGAEKMAAFRKAVEEEGFFEMKEEYGENVPDGSVTTLTVSDGVRTKSVRVLTLINGEPVDRAKLREAARAVRLMERVRGWFEEAGAADYRGYEKEVLKAAGGG